MNHRVLNEYVRMYINGARTDQDKWVKYYAFCYNTSPSLYHNYTSFELVFAYKGQSPEEPDNTLVSPVYNVDACYQEVRYWLQ